MTTSDFPWEPPIAGTETEHIVGALDRLRTTFRWKADDLDAHRQGWVRITRLEAGEEQILRFGVVAVVIVRMEMAGTFKGNAFAGPFRYTRVWCERPDGWRIVENLVGWTLGPDASRQLTAFESPLLGAPFTFGPGGTHAPNQSSKFVVLDNGTWRPTDGAWVSLPAA